MFKFTMKISPSLKISTKLFKF